MGGRWHMGCVVGRWMGVIALCVSLAACGGKPEPRRTARPLLAPAPPQATAQSPEIRQCVAKLRSAGVQLEALPDRRFSGGCTALGSVRLLDFGVPTTNITTMTCPLAEKFVGWARYGVQPAARLYLGGELARIETFGTYACRPIAGSGRLSEHGRSNAVDIAAFVLADGRRISVKNGWNGDGRERQFLRIIRQSACKRFRRVLSPDYNAAHHDHLHFDLGGRGEYCR